MSDNKYLKRQEIVDYPGKKLPVVFLIDVSDSMNNCEGGIPTGKTEYSDGQTWNLATGGISIMQILKERLNDFHDAIKEDRKTSITCQTAYVTFGDKATLIEDFGVVRNKVAPIDKLVAHDNNTYICDALEMSLNMLDEQKRLIRESHSDYYQPWLIILTDGKAQDDPNRISRIKKELIERQKEKKLTVYTMALNDDQELYENIRGYSIYKPIPCDKDKEEIKKFFVFLSQSVSVISAGKIEDRINSYDLPDDKKHLS